MARLGNLDYEGAAKSDLIPDGEYAAKIVESSLAPTKAGTGQILLLVFEITEGSERGQRLWERLNIQNPNEKAQRIATRRLIDIAESVKVAIPVKDSEVLHGKPLRIAVGNKDEGEFGLKNVIKKVMPYSSSGGAHKPEAKAAAGEKKPAEADMPWD
jgi:hypothetical protein